jgi:hypothetical protein
VGSTTNRDGYRSTSPDWSEEINGICVGAEWVEVRLLVGGWVYVHWRKKRLMNALALINGPEQMDGQIGPAQQAVTYK